MKKVQGHKSCKFLIVVGSDKVYKYSLENDESKENWIKALNGEINKLRGDSKKKIENILEVKLKKKVIVDFYNLPNIYTEKTEMKKRIEEEIKNEYIFPEKKTV